MQLMTLTAPDLTSVPAALAQNVQEWHAMALVVEPAGVGCARQTWLQRTCHSKGMA